MSDKRPARVTICIPTYNRSALLRNTVQSVLDQGYEGFEIVISDNASEDDTTEVVAAFGDPRIRYIRHDENRGAHDNINFVVAQAETELVVLVPDDDGLLPGGLTRAIEALDRYPAVGVVHSAIDAIDADGNVLETGSNWLGRSRSIRGDLYETGPEFIAQSVGRGCRICQSTAVVRRELLPVPAFDFRYNVPLDQMLWLNVALSTDFFFIDQRGGVFRRYDESLSGVLWHTAPNGDRVLRDDFVREMRDVKLEWIDAHQSQLADPKALRRSVMQESGDALLNYSRYEPTRLRSVGRILQVTRSQPNVLLNKTVWRRLAGSLRKPRVPSH